MNYLLVDIDGEMPRPTWGFHTEGDALRQVAGWIDEGHEAATRKLVMVLNDPHSSVPLEALYAGEELRRKAIPYLKEDE